MDNPWIDIRNSAGHLLFRYNPYTNEIEFKKGGYAYDLIRLDEIRVKYGVVVDMIAGGEKIATVIISGRKNGTG